jgi:DUF4097 and DUF4098 domain-containing protein YvlB
MDRGDSSVTVTSHAADTVRVDAEAEDVWAGSVRFQVERRDGDVHLRGRVGGALSWLFGGPLLRVKVQVPRRFAVDVRSTAGSVVLEEIRGPIVARASAEDVTLRDAEGPVVLTTGRGDVKVESVAAGCTVESERGDIDIERVAGPVDAETGRGDIEIDELPGDVEARTGRGRIEIGRVGGSVRATTSRGDIEIEDAGGRVEARTDRGAIEARFTGRPAGALETRRGAITVAFPTGAGADVDARTDRGRISMDRGLDFAGEADRGHAVGRVNGGGETLTLRAGRGWITLERR